MKRLIALLAAAGAMTLAACDDPNSVENDADDTPVEQPVAPAAEDSAVPATAPSATNTPPPSDSTTLPPEKRTSEESVQPESETLFY